MIDLKAEKLMGLPELARLVPPARQGKPVNAATVWRWCHKGVKLLGGGTLRLECLRLAGRWVSSAEALARFIRDQTPQTVAESASGKIGPQRPAPTKPSTPEESGKRLSKVGI